MLIFNYKFNIQQAGAKFPSHMKVNVYMFIVKQLSLFYCGREAHIIQ